MTDYTLDKISLLAQRDLDRKQDLQKRKNDKDQTIAINESLEYFENIFTNQQKNIEDLIEKSREIDQNQLANHFNLISNNILTLQKYVANSSVFIRSYDIKRCQEILQDLTNRVKDLEDELLPKKKFAFRNKKSKPQQKHDIDTTDCAQKSTNLTKDICGFTNRINEELIMNNDEIFKKDIELENLENCTVKFYGSPSTLHLNKLKNCRIFTGPVSTSIFASYCENCTLIIACQQLRLHNSRNIKIYLHVTSRAIMEDCKEILLAPYNWKYDNIEEDFKKSGLDMGVNHWTCVDDFNWLSTEKQSPNWAVLDCDLIENFDNV